MRKEQKCVHPNCHAEVKRNGKVGSLTWMICGNGHTFAAEDYGKKRGR